MERKDEFLIQVCHAIGDALPKPLIDIIVQYARAFYVFSCEAAHEFLFYDHTTRQIVDRQPIPMRQFIKFISDESEYSILRLSRDRSICIMRIVYDSIAIFPTDYNVNKIFGLGASKQSLTFNPASAILDDSSLASDTVVLDPASAILDDSSLATDTIVGTGTSLFAQKKNYRDWQRFDLVTKQWDSHLIRDLCEHPAFSWKGCLHVTMIGPNSFMAIEALRMCSHQPCYRCFIYDGDSSDDRENKEKYVTSSLEGIVVRVFPNKLQAFGIVKNGREEMIVAIFDSEAYNIKIKTRSPSLTFDAPVYFEIHTNKLGRQNKTFFILEDQLWVVFENIINGITNLAMRLDTYRFSFETMDWILSGSLPKELVISKFQTIV
jgi:hypothetical protein